jgi:hypothetical protein
VEADVDQRQEVGHAQQRLDDHPEHEGGRPRDGQDHEGHGPVGLDAALQLLRLGFHAVRVEELERGVADHMQEDAVHVEHEVAEARSVDVPLVEGVAQAAVQAVVDVVVRGGEVPGHVAEEHAQVVLEEVPEVVADGLLVQAEVVALR